MKEHPNGLDFSRIFLKINYYAYGNSENPNGVDDFQNIEEFRTNLKNVYTNTIIRPMPTGRGGVGIYQFFIELLFSDVSLAYLMGAASSGVIGNFAYDLLKNIFSNLHESIKKLALSTQNPETSQNIHQLVSCIKMDFEDSSVLYYSWNDNNFFEYLAKTFHNLQECRSIIFDNVDSKNTPALVIMPVLPSEFAKEPVDENITFVSPEHAINTSMSKDEYYRYIALYYPGPTGEFYVLDSKSKTVEKEDIIAFDALKKINR